MKKIDTILYDLDGTLIDTNEIIIESFRETFKTHFPDMELTIPKIHSFIGPTLTQTFSNYTKDPFLIQDMINTYRAHYVKNEQKSHKLYPNVVEVVKKLKNLGYNLGIVTSKSKEAAWPSYTHYELNHYFDSFTSQDDVEHPKPHRNAVDTALKSFPNHKGVIMIGDNQGDILAGKNADVYGVGVSWSLKGKDHLLEVNPDFMLEDMHDIFRVINTIEGVE